MVDEQAYKEVLNDINEIVCPFEKAILQNHCRCLRASHFYLAGRKGVGCQSVEAQAPCFKYLHLLKVNAKFALKLHSAYELLPHNKSIKIQVGGLRGLKKITLADDESEVVDDINQLIKQALIEFGSFEDIPMQEIIRHIAEFKGRKKNDK
ncbi:MAG: hypothetical protein HON94_12265 [Methylococcales bacterium]|jgi:hypothetical protein|nr:hypothetical protein [Methylococcales bacterium]